MSIRYVPGLVCTACCVLFLSPAAAGTLSYFGAYQLDYADNIELANGGGTSGVYHTLGAGLGYEEHGTRLDAIIDGSVEHLYYPDGVLENETSFYLDADVRWAFIPDRFYWVFTDTLTNELIDPTEASISSNWQQTNVFSTGPNLQYQFDLANRIEADIRYMNSWAEESDDFNADRWFAGGSWIYGSATATQISLNATFYDVLFDQSDGGFVEDYQRHSVFVGWERGQGSSTLRIEGGLINIDFEDSDDESGWHGLVAWNHVISSASSLVVSVRHGLTDSALALAGAVDPDNVGSNVVSGEVYEVSAVDASFQYDLTNSVLELLASYEKQDYVTVGEIDRDLASASISWTRNFGGGWSSLLSAEFDRDDYVNGQLDDTYYLYAGAVYRGTRFLTYNLGVNWERRSSTESTSEYDNWGLAFLVRYAR